MKVLIAGGGTGGHINPALSIAKKIKEKNPECEIMFVGTSHGLEKDLVPREGYKLKFIRVKGFRRKISADTLKSVKELFLGVNDARRVIKEYKPDIAVGTGGYVCGPVLILAAMKGIPTIIHEQNALPGVTNKILSRFVDKVAVSFKESIKYFKNSEKVVLTGNPIRSEFRKIDKGSCRREIKADNSIPFVIVTGGSLGAEKINSAVVDMLKKYYKEDFKLLFATGKREFERVNKLLQDRIFKNAEIVPYIYDAPKYYGAADLMVCRAGAITITELTAIGLPSIMIPSPYVAENHQEHNARALESKGGAVVITEPDLTGELLYKKITQLIKDRELLNKMSQDLKKSSITDAADRIYDLIEQLLNK